MRPTRLVINRCHKSNGRSIFIQYYNHERVTTSKGADYAHTNLSRFILVLCSLDCHLEDFLQRTPLQAPAPQIVWNQASLP